MIFVGGIPRSCTSVMMLCLQNSGFYLGEKNHLHGHRYKTEYQPMGLTLQWLLNNKKKINQVEFTILHNISTYTVHSGVEAIKVFNFCFVLPLLKDHEICRNAKYIIMSRDVEDAVESAMRINNKKVHSPKRFAGLLKTWDVQTKELPRIKITYNDVIHNTSDVQERLSNFIGRDIDMSIVSPEKTYEVSGIVN